VLNKWLGAIGVATILVIDDDQRMTREMTRAFASFGHACTAEHDPQQALSRIAENEIDLLILDIMLPRISGFELCRRVRAQSEFHRLPILFISAMSSEEEIAHALAQGGDDFVVKPFRFDALLRRVEGLLSSQRQIPLIDQLTNLPGAKMSRLEVQRAINAREQFSIAYVEILGIAAFGRAVGEVERSKAIRHMSRALESCSKSLGLDGQHVGHVGGGHFICLLPSEGVEAYCQTVWKLWREHLPEFYESIGKGVAFRAASKGSSTSQALPLLEALFCVTSYPGSGANSARDIFEVLSRLRSHAQARGAGIYMDRRK